MRKIIMLFSTLMLIFGALFALSAAALASNADMLQPASITYNEDLTVNGTGRFNSLQVGLEGVGGVTYFNGTVLNVGEYVPFTIGDDMRLDGELWRGTTKGIGDNMPIKISDTMVPTLDDINDLGWPEQRWQNIYYSQMLSGNNINLNGTLSLQPASSSPEANIEISASNKLSLGFTSDNYFKGLKYSANALGQEIAMGSFDIENFMGTGNDVNFTGLTGYDREGKDVLFMGFTENSASGKNIIINAGDAEGSNDARLNITANQLYLDNVFSARFSNRGALTEDSSGCYAGSEKINDGGLARGNYDGDPAGTELYYCEGGWKSLVN